MVLWQGAEGQNTCKLQCNVAVKCSVHVLGSQKSSKFSTTWRPSGDYIHLKGSWFKKENNLSMYNIRKYYTNLHKTFTKFLRTCQIYILSDPILGCFDQLLKWPFSSRRTQFKWAAAPICSGQSKISKNFPIRQRKLRILRCEVSYSLGNRTDWLTI